MGDLCFNCNSRGHLGKDCPSRDERCYNCGENGHLSRHCKQVKRQPGQDLCFNCGGIGHIGKNCRMPSKRKCYTCQTHGHTSAECPLRHSANTNSQPSKFNGAHFQPILQPQTSLTQNQVFPLQRTTYDQALYLKSVNHNNGINMAHDSFPVASLGPIPYYSNQFDPSTYPAANVPGPSTEANAQTFSTSHNYTASSFKWGCVPCNKKFNNETSKKVHMSGHVKCQSCEFECHHKLMGLHEYDVHGSMETPKSIDEESKQWVNERKHRFPVVGRLGHIQSQPEELTKRQRIDSLSPKACHPSVLIIN